MTVPEEGEADCLVADPLLLQAIKDSDPQTTKTIKLDFKTNRMIFKEVLDTDWLSINDSMNYELLV